MAMHRLIYVSAAKGNLSPRQLEEILTVSRRNNARDGLTGLLLYGRQSFIQVLEGRTDVLDARYDKIAADPRHGGLVRMMRMPIEGRGFEGWVMGYSRLQTGSTMEGALLDLTENALGGIVPASAPSELAAFLGTFYRNNVAEERPLIRALASA